MDAPGLVIKGWLVSHHDGWECMFRNKAPAEHYARDSGAICRPLYVEAPAAACQDRAGEEIGGEVVPG